MADEISKIIENVLKQTQGENESKPTRSHTLVYDSPAETLEPIYFWITDFMQNFFGKDIEKLIDNFTSSPGGGHFSELSQKKSIMQKNVDDSMKTVYAISRSVINLIYDLKDFEIRLGHYDDAKSKNDEVNKTGILSLKQIWLDNVDMKRGVGSIHQMTSGNLNYVTLRDAFLQVDNLKQIDKIDLNERVKNILRPRLSEFLKWRELSEIELRNRFQIEKNYLRNQVNMMRLYTRWIKPYLRAAAELEENHKSRSPDVVKTFNTTILELAVLGKSQYNFESGISSLEIPQGLKKPKRDYYSVVLVDFYFRGIPAKQGQHYLFGGKATVNIKSYVLNNEELKLVEQELKKSDIEDTFALIEGATVESLDELKNDLDHFLDDDKQAKAQEAKKEKAKDSNPFTALFSPLFKNKETTKEKEKKEEKLNIKNVKKDSYSESEIRKILSKSSAEACYTIYDVYKKAHSMLSHDSPYD
ncbi:MAG: hypothetical protein U9Q06_03945 [Nanoarchaeota archaeon]|nr:hypothetical protein [Nanoarchaeota archaeon]